MSPGARAVCFRHEIRCHDLGDEKSTHDFPCTVGIRTSTISAYFKIIHDLCLRDNTHVSKSVVLMMKQLGAVALRTIHSQHIINIVICCIQDLICTTLVMVIMCCARTVSTTPYSRPQHNETFELPLACCWGGQRNSTKKVKRRLAQKSHAACHVLATSLLLSLSHTLSLWVPQ